jgi:hypothetical protein
MGLLNFLIFSFIDVICGHPLIGSSAWGPPVFQALSPYRISSQYLEPFSSSGSNTIKKYRFPVIFESWKLYEYLGAGS